MENISQLLSYLLHTVNILHTKVLIFFNLYNPRNRGQISGKLKMYFRYNIGPHTVLRRNSGFKSVRVPHER